MKSIDGKPKTWAWFIVVVALSILPIGPSLALEVEPGEWVELKATNPQGVPLHKRPEPSLFGRALDGSRAEVKETDNDKHWIKIKLEDGRPAWIIERYVDRIVEAPAPAPTGPVSDDDQIVWGSAEGCKLVVDTGRRMAAEDSGILRMGTWNIRWFHDETDLDWLACAIAWMNLDVLSIEEFRNTSKAKTAMNNLLASLKNLTGNEWKIDLHQCGRKDAQHVGFLWNTARVELKAFEDMWQFNARAKPTGSPCSRSLRPGRYAYVKAKGNGVDFHATVVHLKMGAKDKPQQERMKVLNRLDKAASELVGTDEDIIILGDFNTMGNGSQASAAEEIQALASTAASESPGFTRMSLEPACTEYYKGHAGWLDHILVTRGMEELVSVTAEVTGYCAVKSCARIKKFKKNMPAAYQKLSDHCPVVFEVENRDLD